MLIHLELIGSDLTPFKWTGTDHWPTMLKAITTLEVIVELSQVDRPILLTYLVRKEQQPVGDSEGTQLL